MIAPISRRDVLAGALALGSFGLVSVQSRAIAQRSGKLVVNQSVTMCADPCVC